MTDTFLCGTSSKPLYLTGEELKQIPYLASLVEHDDESSSIRNEKGEYVLNPPIPYSWLTAIQLSITSKQPSLLFSQLSPNKDVLGVFRLYDQLGINSMPASLLKDTHSGVSGETEADRSSRYAAYHQANQMEARNTAAEFLVALTKKKYNLDDSRTRDKIFSLVEVILSSPTVFDRRFCLHTLTIVDSFVVVPSFLINEVDCPRLGNDFKIRKRISIRRPFTEESLFLLAFKMLFHGEVFQRRPKSTTLWKNFQRSRLNSLSENT